MYTYIYMYIGMNMYMYMYIYIHMYIYICMQKHKQYNLLDTWGYPWHLCSLEFSYLYVCTFISKFTSLFLPRCDARKALMLANIHVDMNVLVYVCMYVYISLFFQTWWYARKALMLAGVDDIPPGIYV